ncbi:MAG: polymer-forming cytoskeletal protein [Rhodospirillaceae bacterium]
MNTTLKLPSAPNAGPPGGGGMASKPDSHRRSAEPSAPALRRQNNGDQSNPGADARKLFVGRDISLSGEISSCDVMLVEGTVEAKLSESRYIEIADGGSFKGSAEVDEAEVAGRFEGELTVHGRLRVRSSGRIQGRIHYGELQVESGGQLVGDVHAVTTSTAAPVVRVSHGGETSRLAAFPSVPPASVASRSAGLDSAAAPENT